MRISDWSSDVCSFRSDPGKIFRLDVPGPVSRPIVVVVDLALVAPRDDAERPLLHGAIIEIGAAGQNRRVGVREEWGVLVPLHLGAALGPFEVRSEEHTSEVKTLMSNSYAVFSLK